MKIIKTMSYNKISGKKERGKRDGTGPFEDSFRNEKKEDGNRRKKRNRNRGEECPCEDDVKKAQIDPRDIDPTTQRPHYE